MKNTWLWILGGGALAYYFYQKQQTASTAAAAAQTITQQLNSGVATLKSAYSGVVTPVGNSLSQAANALGFGTSSNSNQASNGGTNIAPANPSSTSNGTDDDDSSGTDDENPGDSDDT